MAGHVYVEIWHGLRGFDGKFICICVPIGLQPMKPLKLVRKVRKMPTNKTTLTKDRGPDYNNHLFHVHHAHHVLAEIKSNQQESNCCEGMLFFG